MLYIQTMKREILLVLVSILMLSCNVKSIYSLPKYQSLAKRLTGTEFFNQVNNNNWQQRESLAVAEILKGNYPDFFRKFVPVTTSITDTAGNIFEVTFYVATDYICIGTNTNWARLPLTPMAAQKIADSLNCFLPTQKMVDLIYQQATVKLTPQPLTNNRDSSSTMLLHHTMIEDLRKHKKGLIAGIKKDIVITAKLNTVKNKVAIYGWHQLNGKPIQPLYTGHVNWYVDYSHGARLIYRKIKVNGKMMDYEEVLKDAVLRQLICDEADCSFISYNY